MRAWIRPAFIAFLGVATAMPALAQDTAGPTARMVARVMVGGLQIGADRLKSDDAIAPSAHACVHAIDPMTLAPPYEALLRDAFTDEQLAVLDAFYGSELGELDLQIMTNGLRSEKELPIEVPAAWGPGQEAARNAFMVTPEAMMLGALTTGSDNALGSRLEADMDALISGCL